MGILDTSSTLGSEELKDRHLGRRFAHQDEGQIAFPIWNNEEGAVTRGKWISSLGKEAVNSR